MKKTNKQIELDKIEYIKDNLDGFQLRNLFKDICNNSTVRKIALQNLSKHVGENFIEAMEEYAE